MADVKFEVVTATLNTSTGNQNITISGFGTPKAAICFVGGGADATLTADAYLSIGVTDGTNTFCCSSFSEDGLTTTDTYRINKTNLCSVSDGTTASDFEFTFNAWVTDGIQINITNAPTGTRRATFVLIGGADVSNATVTNTDIPATSAVTVTTGHVNDLVFVIGNGAGNRTTHQGDAVLGFGFCHNDGSGTQRSIHWADRDAQNTTDVDNYVSATEAGGQLFGGSFTYSITVQNFTSTAFDLSPSSNAGGDDFITLALNFANSPNLSVDTIDGPATTGNHSTTAPGFEPGFAMILSTDATSTGSVVAGENFSISVFDGTTASNISMTSQDAVTTSVCNSVISAKAFDDYTDGATQLHEGTFSSFDASGFTLNFTTAPGTARKWAVFTIEGPTGGAYTLTADSGSYSISGASAGIEAGYNLSANTASYSYSGTTVALNYGFNLSANSGSYTYSGTDATLTYTPAGAFTLTAEIGSYGYSGTNAALEAGYNIAANSGSYSYSGTVAEIDKGYTIAANSGAYTVSGTAASFLFSPVLAAESGSYAYSGNTIQLTGSSKVWTVQTNSADTWTVQTNTSDTWTVL